METFDAVRDGAFASNAGETERLIQLVRQRMAFGQTDVEVAQQLVQLLPAHEVFFAVRAAQILGAP